MQRKKRTVQDWSYVNCRLSLTNRCCLATRQSSRPSRPRQMRRKKGSVQDWSCADYKRTLTNCCCLAITLSNGPRQMRRKKGSVQDWSYANCKQNLTNRCLAITHSNGQKKGSVRDWSYANCKRSFRNRFCPWSRTRAGSKRSAKSILRRWSQWAEPTRAHRDACQAWGGDVRIDAGTPLATRGHWVWLCREQSRGRHISYPDCDRPCQYGWAYGTHASSWRRNGIITVRGGTRQVLK